jgi:hypothetical protein
MTIINRISMNDLGLDQSGFRVNLSGLRETAGDKASRKSFRIMHPVFATLRGANGLTGGMPSANALWLGDPVPSSGMNDQAGRTVFAGSSLARSAAFSGFFHTRPPAVPRKEHAGQAANRWAVNYQSSETGGILS